MLYLKNVFLFLFYTNIYVRKVSIWGQNSRKDVVGGDYNLGGESTVNILRILMIPKILMRVQIF